jgi:hypothetical protein
MFYNISFRFFGLSVALSDHASLHCHSYHYYKQIGTSLKRPTSLRKNCHISMLLPVYLYWVNKPSRCSLVLFSTLRKHIYLLTNRVFVGEMRCYTLLAREGSHRGAILLYEAGETKRCFILYRSIKFQYNF